MNNVKAYQFQVMYILFWYPQVKVQVNDTFDKTSNNGAS